MTKKIAVIGATLQDAEFIITRQIVPSYEQKGIGIVAGSSSKILFDNNEEYIALSISGNMNKDTQYDEAYVSTRISHFDVKNYIEPILPLWGKIHYI